MFHGKVSQISVVDPIVPEATIEETIAHDDCDQEEQQNVQPLKTTFEAA